MSSKKNSPVGVWSDLFSTGTFSGALISVQNRISPQNHISSLIKMQHPTASVSVGNDGYKFSMPKNSHSQTIFTHNFSSGGVLNAAYGDRTYLSLSYPLSNYGTGTFRLKFGKELPIPSGTISIKTKHADFVCEGDWDPQSDPRIAGSVSIKGLGMKFNSKFTKDFYKFSFSREKANISTLISLESSNNLLLVMRNEFDANPDIKIGAELRVSDSLQSVLRLAWRAKIEDSVIHSTIDTNGIVSTVYSRNLFEKCDFLISCQLNHLKQDYTCGIGLMWDC